MREYDYSLVLHGLKMDKKLLDKGRRNEAGARESGEAGRRMRGFFGSVGGTRQGAV